MSAFLALLAPILTFFNNLFSVFKKSPEQKLEDGKAALDKEIDEGKKTGRPPS